MVFMKIILGILVKLSVLMKKKMKLFRFTVK